MAKQDDGNKGPRKTPSTKRNIDYSKATRVKEAPKTEEGWVEGKDPISGKKMWYRESGTEPRHIPGTPGTPPEPKHTIKAPKLKSKPVTPTPGTPGTLPTKKPDTYKQEVVYMDDEFVAPEKVAAQSDVAGRSEFQENVGFHNPNFRLMEYSEAGTGGMSKATKMEVDRTTGRPVDISKSFDDKGNYKPYFTSEQTYDKLVPKSAISLAAGPEVNKSSVEEILSNTKNPVTRVGTKQEMTAPLINKSEQGIGVGLQDVKTLPSTELKDKTKSPYYNQFGEEDKITSPKFKDGGYIPKSSLLKRANGGGVSTEEQAQGVYIQNGVKYRKDGTPILTSSYDRGATPEITSANTLPLSSGTEFTPSGDAATSGSATYEGGASTTDTTEKKQGSGKGRAVANQAGQALGTYGTGYHAANANTGNKGSDTRSAALGAAGQAGAIGGAVSGIAAIGDQIGKPIREKSERTDREGNLVDKDKAKRNAVLGATFSPSQRLSYEGGLTDVSGKAYIKSIEDKAKQKIADEQFSASMGSRNERMEAAEGGTIVGKGGPKDDAILSKIGKDGIRSGSFIVPAENNGLAKKLREKFLGGNPEKKAEFKKGGEAEADVAVSNGEHLFTPKEKQKLTTYLGQEILEKLAPNAEENDMDDMHDMTEDEHKKMMEMDMEHKAKGGELSSHKAKIMLHEGKFDSDKQRRFFGWVAGGRKACGGMVKKAEGGNLKAPMVKYANGTPASGVNKGDDFDSVLNEINKQEAIEKQKREALKQQYAEKIKAEKDAEKKAYFENRVREELNTLDQKRQVLKYKKDKIEKAYSQFKNAPETSTSSSVKPKQGYVSELKSAISDYKKQYEKYNPKEEVVNMPTVTAAELENVKQAPADKLGVEKQGKAKLLSNFKEKHTTFPQTATTQTSAPKKAPKVGAVNKTGVTFTPKMTEDTGDFPVVPGTTETVVDAQTIIDPRFKQKAPLNDADAKLLVDSGKAASDSYVAPKTEEKPKWYSGLGSGLEYGASAAQIGMGLRGLNKSGKMPVDKIDPLFQASVDKAQAAAKFGFTPEQQFAIDQDRQNAINAARFSARNFAGGNAGTAFTQERSAINQGWGMGLKAKIAGQELMQDKQRYADTLALQKAGMSRQLYEDKLAGWNQQQQAGSQLLGAGIRNLIGAGRYQKELEAQKQRQQYNG